MEFDRKTLLSGSGNRVQGEHYLPPPSPVPPHHFPLFMISLIPHIISTKKKATIKMSSEGEPSQLKIIALLVLLVFLQFKILK